METVGGYYYYTTTTPSVQLAQLRCVSEFITALHVLLSCVQQWPVVAETRYCGGQFSATFPNFHLFYGQLSLCPCGYIATSRVAESATIIWLDTLGIHAFCFHFHLGDIDHSTLDGFICRKELFYAWSYTSATICQRCLPARPTVWLNRHEEFIYCNSVNQGSHEMSFYQLNAYCVAH